MVETKEKTRRRKRRVRTPKMEVPVEITPSPKPEEEPEIVIPTVIPLMKGIAPNSMNIYPPEMEGIKFENVENPVGHLQQSLNDSRWYHVHIWDKEKKALVPLRFPDEPYYNPKELAQIVGAEPIRRYFERRNELLEKISPWVFLGAMGIIVFAMLIFGGKG